MVNSQLRTVGVNAPAVLAAMSKTPRERFVPAARAALAYAEAATPLGGGRAVGEPMILGLLLTHLQVAAGERVLVVGAATGYAAALLTEMGARVTALEEDPALAATARANGVATVEGPLAAGWPGAAPYDAILIDGAVEELPEALLAQLRDGGRLAAVILDTAGVGRATAGRVVAGRFGGSAFLEVPVSRLPGFARPAAFVF